MLGQMPPAMREQIMRGFGIDDSDLGKPDLGDLIAKRMTERGAALGQRLGKARRAAGARASTRRR